VNITLILGMKSQNLEGDEALERAHWSRAGPLEAFWQQLFS